MASTKKITLKSSDGETFDVDEAVALQSQTIKHMFEDDCAYNGIPILNVTAGNGIPLPNVPGKILAKVIEYCKKHIEMPEDADDRATEDELEAWDTEFVKGDQAVFFHLILAANYLNIKSLLDLTCQTVADMIKGRTPEEICRIFNIKNDFTPEDEEEVRRENMWIENDLTAEDKEDLTAEDEEERPEPEPEPERQLRLAELEAELAEWEAEQQLLRPELRRSARPHYFFIFLLFYFYIIYYFY